MNHQISLFLLVTSILYLTKFLFQFTMRVFQENPEPMVLSKIEQIVQLVAVAYIITYFLN
jgi:hypothetical protein